MEAAAQITLERLADLRRQTRQARQHLWFPLLVFGLITVGAAPLYLQPVGCPGGASSCLTDTNTTFLAEMLGGPIRVTPAGLAAYWLIALPCGFAATTAFYRRQARRTGVSMRTWPAAISALGLLGVVCAIRVSLSLSLRLAVPTPIAAAVVSPMLWGRGTAVLMILAVGLGVLAATERRATFRVYVAGFGALTVVSSLYDLENRLPAELQLRLIAHGAGPLTNVIVPGLYLLAGATGYGIARLRVPTPQRSLLMNKSVPNLDDTVHQRVRLGILTVCAEADTIDFAYLQNALELTPGNLSRHLGVLADAGLIKIAKGYAERRPKTWVQLTRAGAAALQAEAAALKEIVNRVERAPRTATIPSTPTTRPAFDT